MRLLVVSNGHGEDHIAARLASGLQASLATDVPNLEITAFPLVGVGRAYQDHGVTVRGPRRALPSAGLTLHHARLLLADLKAGLIPLTMKQIGYLWRARPDAVLVVGDAYAQALAHLVAAPRRVLQPLVSSHQSYTLAGRRVGSTLWHRTFMERIRAPERWLMNRADKVYTRDQETAAELHSRGVKGAKALGNPVMDGLVAEPLDTALPGAGETWVVALLPGSRGYAARSLALMVESLHTLAQMQGVDDGDERRVLGLVAWAGDSAPVIESSGAAHIHVVKGRLPAVLASAAAVLGTSGTANEQAAGLGLPVVSFAVPPDYGSAFLANQERLLGGAMRVVDAQPRAVASALREALAPDSQHARTAALMGPRRMGPPGGTQALVADIGAWLRGLSANSEAR